MTPNGSSPMQEICGNIGDCLTRIRVPEFSVFLGQPLRVLAHDRRAGNPLHGFRQRVRCNALEPCSNPRARLHKGIRIEHGFLVMMEKDLWHTGQNRCGCKSYSAQVDGN